jgi:molybdopterin molybdotransferase
VHIIVTGKELVSPGNSISDGEIFESNSFGIRAGLAQHFIQEVSMAMVDDNQVSIETCIQEALHCDIVILTGGVSVGDYDFVASALVNCGVKTVFHKVKQKPGKPFYFGKHGDALLFGLPGNPASVMACFYEYVLPAIYEFMGKQSPPYYLLPLSEPLTKKAGLTHFLKGHTDLVSVRSLAGQESYLMNSFAVANCLIELEEQKEISLKGDLVRVRLIN